jgi:ribosomal protein S27AE
MREKDSHCSHCGTVLPAGHPWPRVCSHCGIVSYLNPLPVAAALLPVRLRLSARAHGPQDAIMR